jgi:predicted MFS family arabinose efflux permease/quinol monooxygenase YgiN
MADTKPAEPPASTSAWAPLREPCFRALWIAALASNIGTWMHNVGASWLMTTLTDSALLIALVQTATSLPIVFLALPAGAMADVLDVRRMLIVTQTCMLVAAAGLAVLTLAGAATPWAVLGLTFLLGLGSAATAPAWQAAVPEMVPRAQLPAAVALNSVQFNLGRAIGPAIGGLIVAAAGAAVVFGINAASYLAVIAVLWWWRREPEDGIGAGEKIAGAVGAGVRYIRNSPELQAVLVRTAAFALPASALWALLPLIARDQLRMDAGGYGVLLGCLGTGSVIGAALLPRVRSRITVDRRIALGSMLYAAAMLATAATRNAIVAGVAMVAAGISWLVLLTSFNVATRLNVARWVQARALGVYLLSFQGSMALGSALWGLTAGSAGLPRTLTIAGVVLIAGLAATPLWRLRGTGRADLSPSIRPDPEVELEPKPDDGPVLVLIEYRVAAADAEAFAKAARRLGRIRRRDGAVRWGLFRDVADPDRFVETYVVDSWAEHLRQHERFTQADADVRDLVTSFHTGQEPPTVSHFIHPDAALRQRRWVRWTRPALDKASTLIPR